MNARIGIIMKILKLIIAICLLLCMSVLFAGCAVVISHDRWFLDRICTHILAYEGNGEVFFFEGSYSEYEQNRCKRLGIEEPKRIRYRKLDD